MCSHWFLAGLFWVGLAEGVSVDLSSVISSGSQSIEQAKYNVVLVRIGLDFSGFISFNRFRQM